MALPRPRHLDAPDRVVQTATGVRHYGHASAHVRTLMLTVCGRAVEAHHPPRHVTGAPLTATCQHCLRATVSYRRADDGYLEVRGPA